MPVSERLGPRRRRPGRVLAIRQRDNRCWPGCVLELVESVTDGQVREVREETGLMVVPDRLTGVSTNLLRGDD